MPPSRPCRPTTGLAIPEVRPDPQPWQDPETEYTSTTDAMEAVISGDEAGGSAADGRNARSAQAEDALHRAVYGDLHQIAAGVLEDNRPRVEGPARSTIRPEVAAALRKAQGGTVLDDDEALLLFDTTGVELDALAQAADEVRADRVGDTVTYVVNRNLNFTNICYTGCRFCAFAQRRDDPDAYNLSLDEIADRVRQAWDVGATEVCIQGGIHPDLGGDYYFDVLDAVKGAVPDIHVHAYSPMEVVNGATRLGISIREWLTEAKRRGLGSVPGTAAEILDDEVRWVLTKGKLPADAWIDVITTAHDVGHPDHLHDDVRARRRAPPLGRPPQAAAARSRRTPAGSPSSSRCPSCTSRPRSTWPAWPAPARPGRTTAACTPWPGCCCRARSTTCSCRGSRWAWTTRSRSSQGGVNDLGGTLMEETISRMAGSTHGIRQDPDALRAVAAAAGRPAAERDTLYTRIAPDGLRHPAA